MLSFGSQTSYKNLDQDSQLAAFRKNVELCVNYMCDFQKNVTDLPVFPDVVPGYLRPLLPKNAPHEPEDFKDMLEDFHKHIVPGTLNWVHPDMYAYFPCGNSFSNVLADMLATAIGGVGFSWTSQPSLTELENVMMDWMCLALGLPSHFNFKASRGKGGGCIMGSASDSIFSVIIAARYDALKKLGCYPDQGESSMHPGVALQKLVCYTSSEAHSSIQKGANLALVEIRILMPNERLQITGAILEKAIKKDVDAGRVPFLVIGTIGSTGGVAFDDLPSIGNVARKYGMWMHVDAAYAGNAFILPELQHLKRGLEFADSIEINPYKMINASLELSCLWIRDVEQYKRPWIIDATYLIDEFDEDESEFIERANMIDYRHYGIPLSRRMRALKIWFLFGTYGVRGLQARVRDIIKQAKYLEALIRQDSRFEVTNFVEIGVVCFRQRESELSRQMDAQRTEFDGPSYCDEQNMNLLHRVNSSRKIHMCPCELAGVYNLRFSINYTFSTEKDLDRAWKVVQSMYVTNLDEDLTNTIEGDGKLTNTAFLQMVQEEENRKPHLSLTFGPVSIRKIGRLVQKSRDQSSSRKLCKHGKRIPTRKSE